MYPTPYFFNVIVIHRNCLVSMLLNQNRGGLAIILLIFNIQTSIDPINQQHILPKFPCTNAGPHPPTPLQGNLLEVPSREGTFSSLPKVSPSSWNRSTWTCTSYIAATCLHWSMSIYLFIFTHTQCIFFLYIFCILFFFHHEKLCLEETSAF